MEAKGTSVVATREFVRRNFGEEELNKFTAGLSEESKKIYESAVLQNSWYDIKPALIEPTKRICDLFYGGSIKGAKNAGRFSAEYGLKGIYKLFLKVATPGFIISRAGTILPTYYKPSIMRADAIDKNLSSVKIVEFPEYHEIIEHRIAGWIEKAIELCGCTGVAVEVKTSMLKGDSVTEYHVKWD